MYVDVRSSDNESSENSSLIVGLISGDNLEPAISSSSNLSAYEGEETRETYYVWVDNKVREVFSKYTKVFMLQAFIESVDIILEGVLNVSLALCRCREYEIVCLGRGREPKDFSIFILV